MKFRDIPGWWEDDALFREIVKEAPDPAHFVEVGSWMGRSTACMAELIQQSGKLIRFDQIDTWQGSPYGSHPEKVAALEADGKTLRGEFERHLREHHLWSFCHPVEKPSVEAAELYEPWSLDCVFIDADHRPEAVEADIRAWMPKLKPGGILCGHDWPVREDSPQGVRQGVEAVGLQVETRGMSWWCRKRRFPPLPFHEIDVRYPPSFPGVQRGWWYLRQGFLDLGCQLVDDPGLLAEGYWSPPHRLPDPVHIASIHVGRQKMLYDCSDFTPSHPDLGQPYLAKNCLAADMPEVQPIGQYLGSEPEIMLDSLKQLRGEHERHRIVGVYSNIDERLSAKANEYHEAAEGVRQPVGLRRQVVSRLRGNAGVVAGLWRWSILRPEVEPELEAQRVPLQEHWKRLAASRVAVCLPGVGGDSTRLRTEACAVGTAIVTVEGPQAWPGNWHGCWVEAKRDAMSVAHKALCISEDGPECRRIGRLGQWYFEAVLRPARMAERAIRACAST